MFRSVTVLGSTRLSVIVSILELAPAFVIYLELSERMDVSPPFFVVMCGFRRCVVATVFDMYCSMIAELCIAL